MERCDRTNAVAADAAPRRQGAGCETADFLTLAEARYSVRSYRAQRVAPEKLNYLLECARLAPSAVNFQPWRLYVVESEVGKEALRRCYGREWFAQAPLYIAVCVDEREAWTRKSDGRSHGDVDAAIAAEHICLAAAEQGLGSCWVCNFDVALCREALRLPDAVRPVVLLPIGYAADCPAPKKRKPLDEIVCRR